MVHTNRLQNYTSWSLVAGAPTLPIKTGRPLLLLQLSRDFLLLLLLLLGSPPSLLCLLLGGVLLVFVPVLLLRAASDGSERRSVRTAVWEDHGCRGITRARAREGRERGTHLGVAAGDGGELVVHRCEYLEEARLARPGRGEDADVNEVLLVRVLVAVHLVLRLRRPRHLLRGRCREREKEMSGVRGFPRRQLGLWSGRGPRDGDVPWTAFDRKECPRVAAVVAATRREDDERHATASRRDVRSPLMAASRPLIPLCAVKGERRPPTVANVTPERSQNPKPESRAGFGVPSSRAERERRSIDGFGRSIEG